ncbi:nitrate ABC transporter [Thalassobaculum fulvum]|uniref:Nitrate ABC transporter n=1 Tax=Thalassobaculum fulvum TaxID=1633335 RepID=A0A919CMY7_9PROT|nr:ABC transporter permease [Thalassobaculum fulvum]GHD40934.1 nitrate ABC transporter [Thalassobaculum fulvum]
MTRVQTALAIVLGAGSLLGLVLPVSTGEASLPDVPAVAAFAVLGVLSLSRFGAARFRFALPYWVDGGLSVLGAVSLLAALPEIGRAGAGYWLLLVAAWAAAWLFVERMIAAEPARGGGRLRRLLVPVYFGVWILVLWEAVVRGAGVPSVLLPPPSAVGVRLAASTGILWADFQQTFLKAVLIGYALGCGSAFLAAIAIDRSPFLQRGLLPLGNFVSALPIIGVAPILVMWFGFDWPSKAAVVVVMTFFPMLVNTVAGLAAAGAMERDLMRTYAAGYWQTLLKLRLPAAAPFIFNALKINSTLALIGAIVAEFFGTPIVGMGFRISTEVGRMNIDMVWAEIAVAAVAGSTFYSVVTLVERAATFWHPSVRSG